MGDRPETKFTSELGLKVMFINKGEEWRPEEESNLKLYTGKQPQGKQYDTGGHLMPTFKKNSKAKSRLINKEVIGVA